MNQAEVFEVSCWEAHTPALRTWKQLGFFRTLKDATKFVQELEVDAPGRGRRRDYHNFKITPLAALLFEDGFFLLKEKRTFQSS